MNLERFRSTSYKYISACAKPKRRFTLSAKNLITHLQTSREGLGVFNRDKKEILVNNLFTQYGNLISDSNLQTTEEIFSICEFQKITDFINKAQKAPFL